MTNYFAYLLLWTHNPQIRNLTKHYNDVTMGTIASQITSLTIVYSTVYSDVDKRKHQSSASLAFVRGIHRGPVNSPHKWPWRGKCFHLMTSSWIRANPTYFIVSFYRVPVGWCEGTEKGHSVLGDSYDTLSHTERVFCGRGGRRDGVTQILSTGLVGVDLASKVESSIIPWGQSVVYTVVTSISYPWGDFKGGGH